jgi:hypothetical protein
MSTTFDRGNYVFQCDFGRCRAVLRTETSNFDGAINFMRRSGWRSRRQPGASEWRHICSDCAHADPQCLEARRA